MKRGFTLVELSIVLVIIGLLIGGILVGQSLISSAKLKNVIIAIQQYEVAAQNFRTKYKGLPGDASSFGCTVRFVNTCGDNIIYSNSLMTGGNSGYRLEESFGFWKQLNNSGMLSKSYRGYDGFATFLGDFSGYAPKINYGTGCFINALTLNIAMGAGINFGNSWVIAGNDLSNPQYASCMSSVEAFTLDSKLDDGLPAAGDIIVSGYSAVDTNGYDGRCLANAAGSPYDINGIWLAANMNQQETTPNPDRVGCGLRIKANW